jgi:hypothetical protein
VLVDHDTIDPDPLIGEVTDRRSQAQKKEKKAKLIG